MAKKFYAVANGRTTGVFTDWNSCSDSVKGFSTAKYKSFKTLGEAEAFVKNNGASRGRSSLIRGSNGNGNPKVTFSSSGETRTSFSSSRVSKPQIARSCNATQIFKSGVVKLMGDIPKDYTTKKVYTDGASKNNQSKHMRKAGYGVFFGEDDPRNIAAPLPSTAKQTNQVAELTAIEKAYDHILNSATNKDNFEKYTIATDSRYSIDCLSKWYKGWEKNGWINSQGRPVENKELIQRILTKQRQVNELYMSKGWGDLEYEHVRGHAGHYGNEMADQLANVGAAMSG